MKKILAMLLALVMVFALCACGKTAAPAEAPAAPAEAPVEEPVEAPAEEPAAVDYKVAMITDYGDITDQSFNQTTYEACKDFCETNGVEFTYFKPVGDSTAERIAMVEKAADEGFNVIVMPGFAFAGTVVEAAPEFPEVKFVVLDVSKGDYLEAGVGAAGGSYDYQPDNWNLEEYVDLSNVYTVVYQEELCGYMAGYATVMMGYTKLGFCGGMAVPAVVRYGYGYVQGANAAAAAKGVDVEFKYAYANQFFGDPDITAAMDTWYQGGTEVVFACGGGVYTSVAEAATKVGGKVVGVDTDQSGIIDAVSADGTTITSAMKGLAASTKDALDKIVLADSWDSLKGEIVTLGIISGTDPAANFVGIPSTTLWCDDFTEEDYVTMVAAMYAGDLVVSNDITKAAGDFATDITLEDLGNLK